MITSIRIFEGPDGSGKSTAAAEFAEKNQAQLVHCGPFPGQLSHELLVTYINLMRPALDGERSIVMDRCWISEPIYGAAFRGGANRMPADLRAILETLTLKCHAEVVLCLPPVQVCLDSWRKRSATGGEYLVKESQLVAVYNNYWHSDITRLPCIIYDYTKGLR